jgi:uncharacterized protein (TIGR02145 family)
MIEKIIPTIYKGESIYKTRAGGGGGEYVEIGGVYYRTVEHNGIKWLCSNLLYTNGLTNAGTTPISPTTPAYWFWDGNQYSTIMFFNHAAIENFIQNNEFGDWRIPTISDFRTLTNNFNSYELRKKFGWSNNDGTDESKLSFIGSGYFRDTLEPYFLQIGTLENLWSSEKSGMYFKGFQILNNSTSEFIEPTTQRGYSLRLCKDV